MRTALGIAAVALVAGDLGYGSQRGFPTVPSAWLDEPPAAVAAITTGRVLAGARVHGPSRDHPLDDVFLSIKRRDRDALWGGLAGVFGKEDAVVYGPFTPERLDALVKQTSIVLERTDGRRYVLILRSFTDLACVQAVIARDDDVGTAGWPHEPLVAGLVVAFPPSGDRARLVPRAGARKRDDVIDFLHTRDDRLDREAEYEGDLGLAIPDPGAGVAPGRAVILERNASHVLVETEAQANELLVLSELYLEGVEARVDGRQVPVVPADLALTGVGVPSGKHEVLVTWKVPGLLPGALVSLVALLMTVGLAFVRGKHHA